MKLFIAKLVVLLTFLAGVYGFHVHKLAQGYVDMYYPKFEGKAGSLILGISREHMGIAPAVLEKHINPGEYAGPILNFAFEKTQSPYGEVYLEAIRKKLRPGLRDGLFILGVTPGGFMVPRQIEEKEIKAYDEDVMKLASVFSVSASPNYEYIMKFYGESLYKAYDTERGKGLLRRYHTDGWNEFRTAVDGYIVSPADIDEWTVQGIEGAEAIGRTERISQYRINGLRDAIEFLKSKGRVVLVRTPVNDKFIAMENRFWPNFDSEMEEIAARTGIPYLNYASPQYSFATLDGSHLLSEGAQHFSRLLSQDINRLVLQATAE